MTSFTMRLTLYPVLSISLNVIAMVSLTKFYSLLGSAHFAGLPRRLHITGQRGLNSLVLSELGKVASLTIIPAGDFGPSGYG